MGVVAPIRENPLLDLAAWFVDPDDRLLPKPVFVAFSSPKAAPKADCEVPEELLDGLEGAVLKLDGPPLLDVVDLVLPNTPKILVVAFC